MYKSIFKSMLLLIIPGILFSRGITATSMAKLAPDLQALVAEINPENAHLTSVRFSRVQTVSGPMRETLYPVTIRSTDIDQVKAAGIQTNSDYEGWSTARVTYEQLLQLSELGTVSSVFQGDLLYPLNDLAVGLSGADLVHDAYLNNVAYDGTDVIVLIIDTGIDWTHLDFRDPDDDTKSRILYIWDQTDVTTYTDAMTPEDRDPTNFSGLNYGAEYTNAQINSELDGSAPDSVKQTDTNGHGTAVAGAAVGNGASLSSKKYSGMAPGADIVVVRAGVNSFSDTNLKDALTYAQKIASTTGKPVVVNLSLGDQANAHDGTSTKDEAVDAFTASGNGRVAVVAAGNAGNESIHVSGSVADAATESIVITVPSFTNSTGAGNDYFAFELWWDSNNDVTANVLSPSNTYSYSRATGEFGTSSTDSGSIYLENTLDSDHPSHEDKRIYFRVEDAIDGTGPGIGTWTLQLTNNSGSTRTYHAWLSASSLGSTPLYATISGGNSTYTIASPGVAASAITVGAYTARWRWSPASGGTPAFLGTDRSDDIAEFSSLGPTRDGSQKPDISTPGRGVVTATSTDFTPNPTYAIITDKYHLTEGTSIGAGSVSGAVALLLDYNGSLSASSIKALLTDNADSDTYTGTVPNNEWGYGKLNIFEAMAKAINGSGSVDHDVYSYDAWSAHASGSLLSGNKASVRFSPTTSGDVTGAFIHTGTLTGTSGNNISFEIWSDNSGSPSSQLGSTATVTLAVDDISKNSWTYVSLAGTNASVSSGTDYHIICDNTALSTFYLSAEAGVTAGRSQKYTGTWGNYHYWRMRTVISTNEETLDSSLPVELAFFNASNYKGHIVLKWATESETENLGFRLDRRLSGSDDWKTIADPSKNPELTGQGSSTSRTDYLFWDKTAKAGQKYDYRLSDIPYSAVYKANSIILEDVELQIEEFALFENFPNPFNPSTHIAYQIETVGDVKISISDIRGREIQSWTAKAQEAGYHEVVWNGQNSQGKSVSAGVYLLRVQAGHDIQSRKMLLLK